MRRKQISLTLFVLVVLMIALALGGCSRGERTRNGSPAGNSQPVATSVSNSQPDPDLDALDKDLESLQQDLQNTDTLPDLQ